MKRLRLRWVAAAHVQPLTNPNWMNDDLAKVGVYNALEKMKP